MYREISGLWKKEREEMRGGFCALKRRRTPCVPAAPRGRCKCSTLNGIYRPVLHTRFANKLIHYNRSRVFIHPPFHGWEKSTNRLPRIPFFFFNGRWSNNRVTLHRRFFFFSILSSSRIFFLFLFLRLHIALCISTEFQKNWKFFYRSRIVESCEGLRF